MRKRRSYIRCLALLLALLMCGCGSEPARPTTAPEYIPDESVLVGKTDLTATAFEKAGYDSFSDFYPRSLGRGTFEDYLQLHRNPLDTASYSLGLRKLSEQIYPDTTGLEGFASTLMAQYGFRKDFSVGARGQGSFEEAMAALFRACGAENDPTAAKKLSKRLKKEAKAALTDYLWAAAAALEQSRQACGDISEKEWNSLAAFRMTAPATQDISGIKTAYNVWKQIDEEALLSSGQQLIAASARLVRALSGMKKLTRNGVAVTADTPAGKIIIGTAGDDTYKDANAFLHIEPGGNDHYEGTVAAGTYACPVSVLIDLGGNDVYTAGQDSGPLRCRDAPGYGCR